jgi:hypothetical protein
MAAKGAWTANSTGGLILAADANRAEIVLQHTSGDPAYLGFGEVAVVGQGIRLSDSGSYLQISDYRARLALYMRCATAQTAGGGYQTADRGDIVVAGESTLSAVYSVLSAEVGAFLGYGATAASWTADQAAEIERYVQAGVRQFYYPPAMQGVEPGVEWSFLKPTATLDTLASDAEQDMPDAFGRLLGDFHFEPDVCSVPIVVVSEARIQTLLQQSIDVGRPQYAAVRFKASTGAYGQRQEVVWWPIPDDVYTLTYRYEAFSGKLTGANPYPLGGMKYSDVILESCLAIAEQRANDERGLHTERFGMLLSAAIVQDRKNSARYYGQMGTPEDSAIPRRRMLFDNYPITYKGETL